MVKPAHLKWHICGLRNNLQYFNCALPKIISEYRVTNGMWIPLTHD